MTQPYLQAIEAIQKATKIAIAGHINPDADALATSIGLGWALRRQGKKVDVINRSNPLPSALSFLPGFEKVRHQTSTTYDLYIGVDCGNFDRLGVEVPEGAELINIDHHRSNTHYGSINLIEPDYACSAEVAFAMLQAADWPLGYEGAVNFYVALLSDTGFFGYEGVNERVFDFAKALLREGVNASWAARMLKENQPLSRLRLLPLVLNTLTLYKDATVASLHISRQMIEQSGATVNETDDIVDYARSLATVEVGFLTREEADGSIKVSLRSKSRVDVSKIAVAFGGGGHQRAAGFTLKEIEKDQLIEIILDSIDKELHA